MARPRPKVDLLQHTWRFYSVLWMWAHARRSAHYDATWQQLIRACGYPDDAKTLRSVQRYAALLEEAGLARVYGVKDGRGAWQRLDVELLQAPEFDEPEHERATRPRWAARALTRKQRLRLGSCRAGRSSRRLVPRVHRRSNLRTPMGKGFDFVKPPPSRAVPGRARGWPPAAGSGSTRSSGEQGANGGGCAAGAGCAVDAAAPTGSTAGTGRGGAPPLLATMIRATFVDGPAGLIAAAVAAAEQHDAGDVVEAAWLAVHTTGSARLVERRRQQLDRGLTMLDRFADLGRGRRGAGVELAVRRIVDELAPDAGDETLQTLGGLAAWLYASGRQWRYSAAVRAGRREPKQARPRPRPPGGAWPWPEW